MAYIGEKDSSDDEFKDLTNYECNVDDKLAQSDSEDEIEVFDNN